MGRNNQKGFSAFILIIIMLVVAGLGLTGGYIWNKKHHTGDKESNVKITQQDQKKQVDQQSDPAQQVKHLVIKEWGVQILLPKKLQGDLYYDSVPAQLSKTGGTIESINLRSKELDHITATCAGEKFSMQLLARSKDKLSSNEYEYLQTDLNFSQIGGYWYHSIEPGNQSSQIQKCRDPERTSQDRDEFWISIGGAQAIYSSIHTLEEVPTQ